MTQNEQYQKFPSYGLAADEPDSDEHAYETDHENPRLEEHHGGAHLEHYPVNRTKTMTWKLADHGPQRREKSAPTIGNAPTEWLKRRRKIKLQIMK